MPTVSNALNTKLAAMACHGIVASPYPATARVATVHDRYMNVMWRAGIPRRPMNSAPPIAPNPPIANTKPRTPAPRCSSFFTTYGTRTSTGPMNNR